MANTTTQPASELIRYGFWRTVKGMATVRWYRLTGRCPCGEPAQQYGWCAECIQYGEA